MTPTQQIINSLKHEPEKWVQGKTTLNHENGVTIWTASGMWFLEISKPPRTINIFEKYLLYRAIKRWHRTPLNF